MAYCLVGDVNAKVPQSPFTATSKPSENQITDLIVTISTRMDAALVNLGYVVPVTGTASLRLLREICVYGVLGLAQTARDTSLTTAVAANGREGKNIWLQLYDAEMARLADNDDPFELPDAGRTTQQVLKQSEQVMRSFVQSVDDGTYSGSDPVVSRYQVL